MTRCVGVSPAVWRRAAELYAAPVCSLYEKKLSGTRWHESLVVQVTEQEVAAEEALIRQFTERQELLCAELGLTRSSWLYLATRMSALWDAEKSPNGEHGEEYEKEEG